MLSPSNKLKVKSSSLHTFTNTDTVQLTTVDTYSGLSNLSAEELLAKGHETFELAASDITVFKHIINNSNLKSKLKQNSLETLNLRYKATFYFF